MRNKVVALENETDGVVSVRIPVSVLILFSRRTVDDEVSRGIVIETSDYV